MVRFEDEDDYYAALDYEAYLKHKDAEEEAELERYSIEHDLD